MVAAMGEAKIPTTCAACKAAGHLQVSQEIRDGMLHWKELFACPCGHGFETGSVGLPSKGLRAALLAQDGGAEVWLDDARGQAVAAKVLQAVLGVPEAEAALLVKRVPARLYHGTRVEAAFIAEGLKRTGMPGVRVAEQPKA